MNREKVIKEKIVCPYCGEDLEVNVPEPEESVSFVGKVMCDKCKNDVIIPILPKFTARAYE